MFLHPDGPQVMELMKHGSLHDMLSNKTIEFDLEMVLEIVKSVVQGMLYLHNAHPPILHNNLRSGNVLVGSNFHVKLSDFGLTMKERSEAFPRTPFWTAPELFIKVRS